MVQKNCKTKQEEDSWKTTLETWYKARFKAWSHWKGIN